MTRNRTHEIITPSVNPAASRRQSMGRRIASRRALNGWTQAQLAAEMNVAQPTVSSWESGERSPSLDLLVTLATTLGVTESWLLHGDAAATAAAA